MSPPAPRRGDIESNRSSGTHISPPKADGGAVNLAIVIPMANEEKEFAPFIRELYKAIEKIERVKVYLVTDKISTDRTTELCQKLSRQDSRFITVWAPQNNNVVDAYLRGYREALKNNHDFIIEMDAGLSHNPH